MGYYARIIARMATTTMAQDVRIIAGVPSWTQVLLERILEISGKNHLGEVWPHLQMYMHGGVSFDPYRDAFDRIMQNIRVLQRLGGANPYGLKLAQVGACINVYGTKSKPYVELQIGIRSGEDVAPVNEARERNYPKSISAVSSGFMPGDETYVVDWLSLDKLAAPSTLADAVAEAEQDVDGLVPVRDIGDPIPVRENDAT